MVYTGSSAHALGPVRRSARFSQRVAAGALSPGANEEGRDVSEGNRGRSIPLVHSDTGDYGNLLSGREGPVTLDG